MKGMRIMLSKHGLPPAIVLGMTVNGLGVVRGLGRHEIRAIAVEKHADWSGRFSRYARPLICPDPQTDSDGFFEFLVSLSRKYPNAVLLPTDDIYVLFIAQNEEKLRPHFRFYLPKKETMLKLLNKKSQYQLAVDHGVPMPKTFFPKTLEEAKGIAYKLEFPVIIKGVYSHEWKSLFGLKKGIIAKDRNAFLDVYGEIGKKTQIETMVQEVMTGDDTRHCKICAYLNKNSEPILTFTLRKLRQYPCDFGVGCAVESVWLPEVAEIGLNFMKSINYVGVGSIEFKRDARDEKLKMIEMNSRLWAQNSLPEACGMNFPYTAYLDILGEKVERKDRFAEGVKWVDLDSDWSSFKGYHAQGRLSFPEWIKTYRGRIVFAEFTWDDPGPFLYSMGFGLRLVKLIFKPLVYCWKRIGVICHSLLKNLGLKQGLERA
jgi:predicted ATP-grasp superfamily ATP-dependent carboligase